MNVVIAGIDHSIADVAAREAFSLSAEHQRAAFARAAENTDILGTVILSTCNRTEIYLSLKDGVALDPFALIGADEKEHYVYRGEQAFGHLARMACGTMSRIFGEDQILAQVKNAIAFARECQAADNILEVFFREAVSCAKNVKTETTFAGTDANVAESTRHVLGGYAGISSVLVIGNGEIGRMVARTLLDAGYSVTMTLRQYRHTGVSLPAGVNIIAYDQRYAELPRFDAVVSATSSPHCTITMEQLEGIAPLPGVFIDLAIPRDIDPMVREVGGAVLYDIDSVSDRQIREQLRQDYLNQIQPFLEKAYADFLQWGSSRERILSAPVKTHFPLFVACEGKKAVVVGAGPIGARRILTLSKFDFCITVISPEARNEVLTLAEAGKIQYQRRTFEAGDLEDAFLVVAATNDRALNHRIAMLARHMGIYCSIADCHEECSFYFPSVAENDTITVGICGNGVAHRDVAVAAKKIRGVLHDETNHPGKP